MIDGKPQDDGLCIKCDVPEKGDDWCEHCTDKDHETPEAVVPLNDLLCGKMWGYWCYDRKKFYHVYNNKPTVEMCSPDGFKTNEKEGYGKIMEVIVTAV